MSLKVDKITPVPELTDLTFSGNRTRIIDILGLNAKAYHLEDADFMRNEFRNLCRNRNVYNMPPKLYKIAQQKTEIYDDFRLKLYINDKIYDLLNNFMEDYVNILNPEFEDLDEDEKSYYIVNLLLCEVNINNAVLSLFEDNPVDKWRCYMLSLPHTEDKSVDYVYNTDEWEYRFHLIYDVDRMDVNVGDHITIEYNGTEYNAYSDVVSMAVENEYIIFSSTDIENIRIGNRNYLKYSHVEGPGSKTFVTHDRIYDMNGSCYINRVKFKLPIIIYRMIKYLNNPTGNIIDGLPYPYDILLLMRFRPELKELILSILYRIINGRREVIDYEHDLRKLVEYKIEFRSVFADELYCRNSYADKHHGEGLDYNKIYQKMFR